MYNNTFGDYIEATQLDMTIENMKHGVFDVLPEQMAILCREAGEVFDEKLVKEKTEKFKKFNNGHHLGVQFFLSIQNLKLTKAFPNVFGGRKSSTGGVNTAGLYKKYIRPYGWLNSLYSLAKDNVFTVDGKNSIESVKETNLYKVLTYMSWKTAVSDYEAEVTDKIRNPNKVM